MTCPTLLPRDVAGVDRPLTPVNGSTVRAMIDREFTIKRYCIVDCGGFLLLIEKPRLRKIEVSAQTGLEK